MLCGWPSKKLGELRSGNFESFWQAFPRLNPRNVFKFPSEELSNRLTAIDFLARQKRGKNDRSKTTFNIHKEHESESEQVQKSRLKHVASLETWSIDFPPSLSMPSSALDFSRWRHGFDCETQIFDFTIWSHCRLSLNYSSQLILCRVKLIRKLNNCWIYLINQGF